VARARRFSQAISEGDGISILTEVHGPDDARRAEADGAEGIAVLGGIAGVREATELPILWTHDGPPEEAAEFGADAWLLQVDRHDDEEELTELHRRALDAGLDCAVVVASEDALERSLELVDPDIFLLAAARDDDGESELERVLDLLPDVPAGKLAIAALPSPSRAEVVELERAGVDAVLVDRMNVAELVGGAPPEV